MKKKTTSIILCVVSVLLIIMGILIPLSMEKNAVSFSYRKEEVDIRIDKYFVTITSGKELNINQIEVLFEDSFDNTKTALVYAAGIEQKQQNKNFTYKFSVELDTFSTPSLKIEEITIFTANGELEVDNELINDHAGVIFVRVLLFVAAGITLLVGIVIVVIKKDDEAYLNKAKQQLAKKHPELDLNNMSEKEILDYWQELNNNKSKNSIFDNIKEIISNVAETTSAKEPASKTCQYCGTLNNPNSKKCESCGASLTKK